MNCTELIVTFDKHDLKLVGLNQERFITLRYLALALQTKLGSLKKLVREMRERGELREGVHLKCTPLPTNGGEQLTTLVTYRGVIRIAMRSDSPRAARFRDWAEEVLYTVMVGPDTQEVRLLIEKGLKRIGTANDLAARQTCDLILSLRNGEPTTLPMARQASLRDRGFVTATEWVKKCCPGHTGPYMNGGGRFERFVARRYLSENGRWPDHDVTQRLYAWLYSPQRDRQFLEKCLVEFLSEEHDRLGNSGNSIPVSAGQEIKSC